VQHTKGGPNQFQQISGGVLFDNEWHHAAGTYDMKNLRAYIDGVSVIEAAFADKPDTNSAPITIGGYGHPDVVIKGIIDDVGLFNVGLAEDEVNKIMTEGLAKRFSISAAVSASGNLATTWARLKVQ
jgi:hypothetical protein